MNATVTMPMSEYEELLKYKEAFENNHGILIYNGMFTKEIKLKNKEDAIEEIKEAAKVNTESILKKHDEKTKIASFWGFEIKRIKD